MDFWIKAAQLIVSLSILVVLHELGHFIPARLFKTKVEKFYLFFNWPMALFRANKRNGKWQFSWFSNDKKESNDTPEDEATEWGIGMLPLGGYVKIAGMVDESMDTEQLSKPPQPWEFRSKPTWQRLIIMIGGVLVNLILGIFIYICLVYAYGEEQLKPEDLQSGLSVHPYLSKYGLHSGDNILKVNGKEVNNVSEINNLIMLRGGRALLVQRAEGKKEIVRLPEKIDYELFQQGAFPAFGLRHRSTKVKEVSKGKAAAKAGLKTGDQLIFIEKNRIAFYDDIQRYFHKYKNKIAHFQVLRGKDTVSLEAKVNAQGMIGFAVATDNFVDASAIHQNYYSFAESIGRGIQRGVYTLSDYSAQLKFIFTKKGASSIGGFASIGNMFPPLWDWEQFWMTTALLSIILAFMNILPIPALDGGHVVFLIYEMITGRQAPQKVLEYAQYIGFILLMSLVIYANGNDIIRWIFP